MALAADAVKDDPGQLQVRVKRGETVRHRRRGPGHGPGIHDQDCRQAQPFGHLGRGTRFAGPVITVEQSHHPFHQGKVSPAAMPAKNLEIFGRRQHPAVQVRRLPSGRLGMMPRVDKIRPHLKRLNQQTATAKRRHQAQSHRGFAHAAVDSGDYQAPAARTHGLTSGNLAG